jgi:drug/metabolite transporter (DMT)-like permease
MRSSNLRGIIAMIVAVGFFSVMDASMKILAQSYPALEVAALRGISSLPLVVLYVVWRRKVPSLFQVRWRLHFLRAALGIAMLGLFAFGLKTLPLAEAYTLSFIAPMLITALSVWLLKENVSPARWVAIAVGFAGVLVVLRPTGDSLMSLGGLAILSAAVAYSVTAITVRIMARSDSAESLIFWLTFMVAVGASILAAPNWVAVRMEDWAVITTLAVTGFIAQIFITEAFRHGEASAIAPFEYTALAWGMGIDYVFWQTFPDAWTLAGAAIIISAGIYLVRSERKRKIVAS